MLLRLRQRARQLAAGVRSIHQSTLFDLTLEPGTVEGESLRLSKSNNFNASCVRITGQVAVRSFLHVTTSEQVKGIVLNT